MCVIGKAGRKSCVYTLLPSYMKVTPTSKQVILHPITTMQLIFRGLRVALSCNAGCLLSTAIISNAMLANPEQ